MPTLILTPRQTQDAQSLWRAALDRGWDVHRLSGWRISDEARQAADPFLYVEALFGPTLADELGLELLGPSDDWLPSLPLAHRKRHVELTTLGRARLLEEASFVKPPNDKSFSADVYEPGALPAAFDDDMAVLVSEPVRFVSEFRCFVLDRRVRASSLYARDGAPCPDDVPTEAEGRELDAFVSAILGDSTVTLPHACALDVGVVADRGWSVVEMNGAWGAGLYQCDPDAVLDVVRAASRRRELAAE